MNIEERDRLLRALIGDPRADAVLALIEDHEQEFITVGSEPRMAADGNKQSHVWGSVHALRVLREELKKLVNAPPPELRERRRREG